MRENLLNHGLTLAADDIDGDKKDTLSSRFERDGGGPGIAVRSVQRDIHHTSEARASKLIREFNYFVCAFCVGLLFHCSTDDHCQPTTGSEVPEPTYPWRTS